MDETRDQSEHDEAEEPASVHGRLRKIEGLLGLARPPLASDEQTEQVEDEEEGDVVETG
jgi:hypothetical protein